MPLREAEKDRDGKDERVRIRQLEAITAKRQEVILATTQVLENEVTELRNRYEETPVGVRPCIGSASDTESQCSVRVDSYNASPEQSETRTAAADEISPKVVE